MSSNSLLRNAAASMHNKVCCQVFAYSQRIALSKFLESNQKSRHADPFGHTYKDQRNIHFSWMHAPRECRSTFNSALDVHVTIFLILGLIICCLVCAILVQVDVLIHTPRRVLGVDAQHETLLQGCQKG